MVEIIEATPEMHAYFGAIQAAARSWDGKTPEQAI
jgi:hypothetical protein